MRNLFRIMFLTFVLVLVTSACIIPFGPRLVRGSGDIVVEERDVRGFNEIVVTGAGRVIITQGDEESLTVETDDNLMEYVETKVKGDTLEIGFKEGTVLSPGGGRRVLEPTEGFIFRISVIELNSLVLSGAARCDMEKLKTGDMKVVLSGAGDINLEDLNADSLDVVMSGAGDIQVSGAVESQIVRLTGLGRYQGFDLESERADVSITGAGGAEVWVEEELDVFISGAGDVKYYGDPVIDPSITGLGRLQGMGEK